MNRPLQVALRVLTILLITVGVIWILQGFNVLPDSFMTGQNRWVYRGEIVAIRNTVNERPALYAWMIEVSESLL
jgi:hypothetical protein